MDIRNPNQQRVGWGERGKRAKLTNPLELVSGIWSCWHSGLGNSLLREHGVHCRTSAAPLASFHGALEVPNYGNQMMSSDTAKCPLETMQFTPGWDIWPGLIRKYLILYFQITSFPLHCDSWDGKPHYHMQYMISCSQTTAVVSNRLSLWTCVSFVSSTPL